MAIVQYWIGTHGPFEYEDTDPEHSYPEQMARKQDVADGITVLSNSVETEMSYGQSATPGTSDDASRSDHTHGTVPLPTLDQTTSAGANSSRLFSCGSNVALTPVGGLAVRMVNKTGSSSVKGTVVTVSSTTDNGVQKIIIDVPSPIGVIYEDGIADGSLVWVVVSGIAEVYYIGSVTRGGICRGFLTADAGYVSGQALYEAYPTSPFATDKHFYEIGHAVESRTGAGLAKTVLHFN